MESYLLTVPGDRREILQPIRAACIERLSGFDEAMRYGMPTYLRDGVAELAWASQKQHISLYVMRTDVLAAHQDRLAGLSVGKGCIRYRRPAQVDLAVVESMLTMTALARGPVC